MLNGSSRRWKKKVSIASACLVSMLHDCALSGEEADETDEPEEIIALIRVGK